MRETFHGDLDRITEDLVAISDLVRSAIERATTAILSADVQLADQVIDEDREIDRRRHALDSLAIDLLARQAPVASDLRRVVAAMRVSSDLERMGDLARHVAKITRLRYPESAVPAELHDMVHQMGLVAGEIITKVSAVIVSRSVIDSEEVDAIDDRLDELHRHMYVYLSGTGWQHGASAAVDMALLARYYERFGDHAVSVARRVRFMVTGESELEELDKRS